MSIEELIKISAETIIDRSEHLTALDQAIGDGDHGVNMKRGMEAVLAELPKLSGKTPSELLKAVGMQLVMKVGGASGPLFGSFALEFGKALPPEPSRHDINTAFALGVAAVAARGKSQAGQKTMLDVLFPVSDALLAGQSPEQIKSIALAAAEGTIPIQALRGRASFLGERSMGHMDPGACSTSHIIATICDRMGA